MGKIIKGMTLGCLMLIMVVGMTGCYDQRNSEWLISKDEFNEDMDEVFDDIDEWADEFSEDLTDMELKTDWHVEYSSEFDSDDSDHKNFVESMHYFGISMGDWGEEFGRDMAEWGTNFGQDMGSWGADFGREMADFGLDIADLFID